MLEIHKNAYSTNDTIIASFHNSRYLMAPHVHQMAELVYVIEGEFIVISSGKREIAKAGDIVIVHPYQPHGYFTEAGKNVNFWMLLFEGSLISDIMREGYSYGEYSNLVFSPSEELKVFLKNKMIDSDEKHQKLNANELRRLKATLYPIFDEYITSVPMIKESEKIRSASVSEAFKYLSNHFQENITLKDVSMAIGYSASHLSHSFSEIVGMNFRTILNSIRINHAKTLLLNTNTNVLLISVECGFGSERSFHRAFQSTLGMTPREYRVRYAANTQKNH